MEPGAARWGAAGSSATSRAGAPGAIGFATALTIAVGWAGGCALQLQMPVLWPVHWVAALCVAAGGLAIAAWLLRRHNARAAVNPALAMMLSALPTALASTAALLLAFSITHQRAQWRLDQALSGALEGVDLVVVGTVASLPRQGLDGARFVFEVEQASRDGTAVQVPPRLSLGWWRGIDDDALLGGPPETVRAGQRWRLPVRLRQPHGHLNPHGFDLELWLFEQGIAAQGSVSSRAGAGATAQAQLLQERAGQRIERLRQDVRDAIQQRVADPATAGVLAALAIGDQAAIEREDWALFRITGVAHLMSISGLHVTMFAWLAGLAIGRLWRLRSGWMLACPAPLAARWGGLIAAAGYAVLAGWGVPAQRTVWMIATVVLLRQAGLRWPLPAVLMAALVVVTALDPWALLQPGFWLSFTAVALLVVSEPAPEPLARGSGATQASGWRHRTWAAVRQGLRTQAVATVGLAPLSLVFFQQISIVGFAANLLAIPLVTLLITPLALAGVLLPPLWALAAWMVQGLSAVLQLLASVPLAQWQAAVAPGWAMAAGLLAALLAVLPLPWRLRLLALPLMLPLLAPVVARPQPGSFELVAADIGQGTAVLLRTAHHLLVYDTGPHGAHGAPESDAGSRVLLPLLQARGEAQIDLLMLSHRDSDHVGGAAALLRGLPVRAMSSSLEPDHPLRQAAGVQQQRCEAGQAWHWDGVDFTVLHPPAAEYALAHKSNAVSCVLRVQDAAGRSVLLTGDIEAAQEAALLVRDRDALRADLLLVPHHGSRTSSTAAFLDAVAPQQAVVQAAYRSRYGHPAPAVLARYQARGIQVLRSDRCGAYTWAADRSAAAAPGAVVGPMAGVCARDARRRYWHHVLPLVP